jgi:hypothetical protein
MYLVKEQLSLRFVEHIDEGEMDLLLEVNSLDFQLAKVLSFLLLGFCVRDQIGDLLCYL